MTKEQEIQLGKENGFIPINDYRRGCGWPYFKKDFGANGILIVWLVRDGWQTSVMKNGYNQSLMTFSSLEEALKRTI